MPRYFTVAEAEALLPDLQPLLERLRELHRQLGAIEQERLAAHWQARHNGPVRPDGPGASSAAEHEQVVDEMNRLLHRVHALGAEVKDLELGLVDFPHVREGRVVYLCWKLGEPRVAWWHELEAGYAGRQPL